MIQLRQTRTARLLQAARDLRAKLLDGLYSPIISRLSDDDYFASRTRNDCVRAYVRATVRSRVNARQR